MGRRKSNVIPMIRDRRRPPRWTTGLPRRRPRRGWRLADPRTFLGAVIVLAATGLVVLPAVADGYLAVARPGSGADGRCRICRVVDGDTARMWCPGRGRRPGPPHRLRRAGTPFAVLPLRTRRRHPRATWARRLALLRADEARPVREGSDRHGRTLVSAVSAVSAFLDGAPLARRMTAAGHARAHAGGARQGWCT